MACPNKFLPTSLMAFILSNGMLSTPVEASDNWQSLPQPIGNLVQLWSSDPAQGLPFPVVVPPYPTSSPPHTFPLPTTGVEEVNYICAQLDPSVVESTVPFETTVSVTEITPTEALHFVRLYTQGSSGTGGPWLVRSSVIRGLTPAQIRDFLALPNLPDSIISVDIPPSPDPASGAQYALWTGIAAPVPIFGNSQGGALQSRIVANANGTHYFPFTYDGIRYNAQPLRDFALAYSPLAGGGNPGAIAAYLDQFVPAPYSDLEDVYTSLDFLNWIGFDPPLPLALNQLSPECYGSLPFVAMRNSILFADSILERYNPLRQCQESCGQQSACLPLSCNTRLWIQGVIDFGDQNHTGKHLGFDYATYGTVINVDFQPLRNTTVGIAGSWLATNIHWDDHIGGAHCNSAKGGLYASYVPSCFFIDTMVSGGFNWTSATRHIDFPIAVSSAKVTATGGTIPISNMPIDRKAHSNQTGYDLEAHFQTGFNFHRNCWWATPVARISYFYESHYAFKEHGADSINLKVRAFDAQDLRTYLGLGAARIFTISSIPIIPQIQAMWIHDFVLNDREIKAGLEDLDGTFSVKYFRRDHNSFLGSAGLKVLLPTNTAVFALYEIEVSEHFISNSGRLDFRIVF